LTNHFYHYKESGFTLIEIMVVMIILSIAFAFVIPEINNFFSSNAANRINRFDGIIADAYKKAAETDAPVAVWGTEGSDIIHIGKKDYELKNDIFSIIVNGKNPKGIKYYFFVYPDGIMDSVQIVLDNGRKLESFPLLLHFKSL